MFPIREKEHEMKTREDEKFIAEHAHTERLKKSSIPYMQRMLNKHEEKKSFQKDPRIRMPG